MVFSYGIPNKLKDLYIKKVKIQNFKKNVATPLGVEKLLSDT